MSLPQGEAAADKPSLLDKVTLIERIQQALGVVNRWENEPYDRLPVAIQMDFAEAQLRLQTFMKQWHAFYSLEPYPTLYTPTAAQLNALREQALAEPHTGTEFFPTPNLPRPQHINAFTPPMPHPIRDPQGFQAWLAQQQQQPPKVSPQPQTNAFVPRNPPPPPTFSLFHPPTLPSLSEPPQPKPPEYLRPGGHVPFTDQRPPFIPSHWVPFIGLDGSVAWMEPPPPEFRQRPLSEPLHQPPKVNTSAEVEGDWRPDWVIETERQQEAAMTTAPPVAFAYERPPNVPLSWHYHVGSDGRVGWIPPPEEQYNGFTMAYYPDKDEWAYV